MAETLVEALRSIERVPEHVKIDKNRAYTDLLNEARKSHSFLDKAIRGETSVYEIIGRLSQKYEGWRLLLPRFTDKEHDRKLDELGLDRLLQADALRTDSSQIMSEGSGPFLGWFYDKMANPVVLPLLMGGFTTFISGGQGRFESEIANYSANFGVGALAGLFVGLTATMMKYQQTSILKKQAKYLQAKIQEAVP